MTDSVLTWKKLRALPDEIRAILDGQTPLPEGAILYPLLSEEEITSSIRWTTVGSVLAVGLMAVALVSFLLDPTPSTNPPWLDTMAIFIPIGGIIRLLGYLAAKVAQRRRIRAGDDREGLILLADAFVQLDGNRARVIPIEAIDRFTETREMRAIGEKQRRRLVDVARVHVRIDGESVPCEFLPGALGASDVIRGCRSWLASVRAP